MRQNYLKRGKEILHKLNIHTKEINSKKDIISSKDFVATIISENKTIIK